MYAWFLKNVAPMTAMEQLFANPRCNLHEFWQMGHIGLYFRHVSDASPLSPGPGTLVSDNPLDTFLFTGSHETDKQKQMQHEWKPMDVFVAGKGRAQGCAWMGVDRLVAEKVRIDIPTLKELHEQRIIQTS